MQSGILALTCKKTSRRP